MRIDICFLIAFFVCMELVFIGISTYRENRKVMFPYKFNVKVIKCEICSYVYVVSPHTVFSKCPMCLSINKLS
ncbi:MAG: hypothetical protein DRP68_04815 [Candidatus Omnitrophota bacterium]|nr:hypothetical protein [Candidatus Omnitrophota bacterium]RKY31536.1 MAG: hypothetical protein DRP68_04815 [Candidatus Omnitrophota bacterium]RKY38633.1 MAG: hypothetical protein DRP72_01450 [Candidatus Omnitrophota bacterium]RKY46302.1 MAG: hypothetical protein DRP81_01065 [Candidatus Omnitrophota bacterium]